MLTREPALDRASFIVSPGNAEALAAVDNWREWPDPRLVLVGPSNAGKSHLATIWASLAGARILSEAAELGADRRPVVLEDADRHPASDALFHLLDSARPSHPVLMTARRHPRDWPATLPDLRSRLNALRVVELAAPDDVVLLALMAKFFRERNIRPKRHVLPFLVRRIERSAAAAFDIVARIDDVAAAEGREVTRALAREVLDRRADTRDVID